VSILASVVVLLTLIQIGVPKAIETSRVIAFSISVGFIGSFIFWQGARLYWYGQYANAIMKTKRCETPFRTPGKSTQFEQYNEFWKLNEGASLWMEEYKKKTRYFYAGFTRRTLKIHGGIFLIICGLAGFLITL
jgi:hypothetical protein